MTVDEKTKKLYEAVQKEKEESIRKEEQEKYQVLLFEKEINNKKDKKENKGGWYAHGNTEDTFCSIEEVPDHLVHGEPAVCQRSGHITAEETVSQETEYYNNNRQAYNTARRLDNHKHPQHSHERIHRCHCSCPQNKLLVIHQNINRWNRRDDSKCQIDRMHTSAANPLPFSGA